jgi:hypothetical protein
MSHPIDTGDSALAYLDARPLDGLAPGERRLMNLLLSLAHVALAVEIQGPDEIPSAPWRERMRMRARKRRPKRERMRLREQKRRRVPISRPGSARRRCRRVPRRRPRHVLKLRRARRRRRDPQIRPRRRRAEMHRARPGPQDADHPIA